MIGTDYRKYKQKLKNFGDSIAKYTPETIKIDKFVELANNHNIITNELSNLRVYNHRSVIVYGLATKNAEELKNTASNEYAKITKLLHSVLTNVKKTSFSLNANKDLGLTYYLGIKNDPGTRGWVSLNIINLGKYIGNQDIIDFDNFNEAFNNKKSKIQYAKQYFSSDYYTLYIEKGGGDVYKELLFSEYDNKFIGELSHLCSYSSTYSRIKERKEANKELSQ